MLNAESFDTSNQGEHGIHKEKRDACEVIKGCQIVLVVKPDARLTGLHWHLNRLTTIIKHRNCFCIDVEFSTTSQDLFLNGHKIKLAWVYSKR